MRDEDRVNQKLENMGSCKVGSFTFCIRMHFFGEFHAITYY